jgi:hypothetical protein
MLLLLFIFGSAWAQVPPPVTPVDNIISQMGGQLGKVQADAAQVCPQAVGLVSVQ